MKSVTHEIAKLCGEKRHATLYHARLSFFWFKKKGLTAEKQLCWFLTALRQLSKKETGSGHLSRGNVAGQAE